ncbi:MAG: hypothetical protein COA58_15335 [Bacteroidetes bacterium]|nr:MAG: hypothetical protein COA58_15335 [Bacteroidota bacterium]
MIGNVLFVGVHCDWSDGDLSLFIKKKPSLTSYFYSPEKMVRYLPRKLEKKETMKEEKYQEFCSGFVPNSPSSGFPIAWIQLTTSLFMMTVVSNIKSLRTSFYLLGFHFFISIWITGFGIVFLLLLGEYIQLIVPIILILNYLVMYLFTEKRVVKILG